MSKKFWIYASLIAAASAFGCTEPTTTDPDNTCDSSATPTCTGKILTYCENGVEITIPCATTCSPDGKQCANNNTAPVPTPQCDSSYQMACSDGKVSYCANNTINYINCPNGCSADGKTCATNNGQNPDQNPDQNPGQKSCDPATTAPVCANSILTTCENNSLKQSFCPNGCNAEANACASNNNPAPECDDENYPATCISSVLTTCVNGKITQKTCEDGCNFNGDACNTDNNPIPQKECDSATTPDTCTAGTLTKCIGDKFQTTSCTNGCNAEGNACAAAAPNPNEGYPACTAGAGTKKDGEKYNQYTYTGCACDTNTYKKSCGKVNGVEVAFTCYQGNEEYLACDSCTIDSAGKYQCGGGGGGGGGSTVAGAGEVNIVDAKYAELNITENSTKTASIEKHGNEQLIDATHDPEIQNCGALKITNTANTCEKSGTSTTKYVIKGDILTKDKTYLGGAVVVENNKITYVGCTPNESNASVITCPNAVVSAGFINAHDHITFSNGKPGSWGTERFDHRHDWRKGKNGHTKVPGPGTSNNEVAELRQIMGGTTSIFGSGSVKGLARNIDRSGEVDGASGYPTYDTFPLSDSGGTLAKSGCTSYKLSGKFNKNYFYGPHIGEGINDEALNEFKCLSNAKTGLVDQFSPKLAVIHGVSATPEVIKYFADTKANLIWSPRTNVSLYGDTARVTVYDNMGVNIALGSDWIYSGSANMLREFECVDFLNTYYYNKQFSDYDLWMMATYNGAKALGYDKYLGNLATGLLADIAVFKKGTGNKNMHRAVLEAENKDVTFVMINGKAVYGDANIMAAGDAVSVCGVNKKVNPTITGTTMSYSSIRNAAAYDLFFCGKPANEPTCVPIRTRPTDTTSQKTTMYDGDYSDALDRDGDGIPDKVDNCPDVFNPVRPEDKNASSQLGQGDYDGDGFGDVCDKYPFDKTKH